MASNDGISDRASTVEPPTISPWLLWLFRRVSYRKLRRGFHAVRVAGAEHLPPSPGPLVIYLNHPSWWDPLLCLALGDILLPGYRHYAPMEAEALERYGFFTKLGVFGVAPGYAGARRFLRLGEAILSAPNRALWITPEGRFCDPRDQPPLAPGLGHLARRLPAVPMVPLAVEYPFWDEPLPEALARFGKPVYGEAADGSAARAGQLLWERLRAEQAGLREDALLRSEVGFDTLLAGGVGVDRVYDVWRRLKAWLRGERAQLSHRQGGD